jgi:hypothetical protein
MIVMWPHAALGEPGSHVAAAQLTGCATFRTVGTESLPLKLTRALQTSEDAWHKMRARVCSVEHTSQHVDMQHSTNMPIVDLLILLYVAAPNMCVLDVWRVCAGCLHR